MTGRAKWAAAAGLAVALAGFWAADPVQAGRLYGQMWANWWTPSAWTLLAIGWHALVSTRQHQQRMVQAAEHHEDLKAHVIAAAGGGL